METKESLFDNLQKKIENILEQNSIYKKKIQQLEQENNNFIKIINEKKNSLIKIEEENSALRCGQMVKTANNEQVKKKINEMVREIDKCIAYLNK